MKLRRYDFLLLEDETFDAKVIERSLGQYDKSITFYRCTDGIDGLNWLRHMSNSELPEFLMVDINMPKMDGFEFVSAVRGQVELADLPIVMMTSSDSPHDIKRSKELGVQGYFVKSRCSRDANTFWSELFAIIPNQNPSCQ